MNIKEYIKSGIVESYVLGITTDAERREFEEMCSQHPELVEAREAFERALEDELLRDAKQPPADLKQKVLQSLTVPVTSVAEEEYEENYETPVRSMGVWKWVAAASLILLAGAAYWAFTTNQKYSQLQAENKQLQEQMQQNTSRLTELEQNANIIYNPHLKVASLQSQPVAPGASGKVFWDSTSKDVFLVINNLPLPASDKQYQLWALLDGQPQDLGVFELKEERLLVKMKGVQQAQAFAITLEPKGGSPSPTGDMYVMGKL